MDATATATTATATGTETSAPTSGDAADVTNGEAQGIDASSEGLEEPLVEANADNTPPWKVAKHKVKVDGQELEVDYDDLIKSYQLEKALTQRSQKIAEERKHVQSDRDALAQFLNQAKKEPKMIFDLAKELGHDPEQLAEDLVWQKIQWQKMSEPERKAIEKEREAMALRAELEKIKQQQDEKELSSYESRAAQQIQDDVIQAVKLSGLKPNKYIVARAAEIYKNSFKLNGEKLAHEVAAKKLRRWFDQEADGYAQEDPETFLGRFSETTRKRIKDYFVKEAMNSKQAKLAASQKTPPTQASKKKEKIGIDDYFKRLGK